MNSQEIQEQIYKWACNHNFTAPYGVLTGSHTNSKGKKYLSVTFGYARTLDATVEIYNRNFMILKRSNHYNEVFNSFEDLQSTLNSISI